MALRKQRFGGGDNEVAAPPRPLTNAPDWEKRLARAKRFGLPVASVPKTDTERWKARAERFGVGGNNGLKTVSFVIYLLFSMSRYFVSELFS